MSENIEVKTTLTAHDLASPVLKGFLANLKKLEANLKGFNSQFANLGRAGAASIAGINRDAESMIAKMSGVAASVQSASRSYANDWRRATDQRLSDARPMYRQLDSMERSHQRQIKNRVAAERRAERHTGYGREFGRARMPAPRLRSLAFGGAIAIGSVAGAFKQRMDSEATEIRTQMFGGLSRTETSALRKSFADKAAIKYGLSIPKTLDVVTEFLKAGIPKELSGDAADLALKGQTALDISTEATAKLMGRLSTQMPFSKDRYGKILNAIAVANNATAADGNEIVESMRRSLSVLVTSRMTPEQLSAIDATNVSLGIQPYKSGTFLSNLFTTATSAESARGQKKKDLSHAANVLGFNGRAGMARMARESPIEFYQQLMENLAKLPEKLRGRVAKELGGTEWADEILTATLGIGKLKQVLKEIKDKPGFIDKAVLQRVASLSGRWASISVAMGLFFEKVGAGFEVAFTQISDGLLNIADTFNFDSIRDHFAALVDGLRQGFGLKDWGEAIKSMADMFDAGTIAKWRDFGKGFAEGLREIVTILKSAFIGMASLFGKGDAESMGKFTARLLGLTVALALVAPVVNVLGSISLFLLTIGAVTSGAATGIAALFVALTVGLKLSLSWIANRIFDSFAGIVDPIVGAIKSIATKTWDWIKGLFGFSPSSSGGASGSWEESSFSDTRKQVATISASPASYIGSDVSSITGGSLSRTAFESTFAGTALAGQHDAIVASAKANGVPPALLAAVIAHETGSGRNVRGNNVAGLMNPETNFRTKQGFATINDGIAAAGRVVGKNYRLAGGDLAKMGQRYAPTVGATNDPNGLNGNWVSGVRNFRNRLSGGVDTSSLGDPVDIASRYLGKNEYANRAELSQFVKHDVVGPTQAWCSRFVNASLREAGLVGTSSAIANSFQRYGIGVSAQDAKRGDILVEPRGRGYNQPCGHVGFYTGQSRMKSGRLQLQMLGGNQGDAVSEKWIDSDSVMVRRSIQNVPPADMIANVPPSSGSETSALLKRNGSAVLGGGAGGPVAININGNSHDPEALATLVQRRIDEAMNWQMHDIDHALT